MGIIEVSGIRVYAYHGCHEEERIIGGNYIVDVTIHTDFEEAAQNDDLAKTVNYDRVYEIVKREMRIPSNLIEHVAKRIAHSLVKEIMRLDKAEIKVTKINPPVNGEIEKVSVVYSV